MSHCTERRARCSQTRISYSHSYVLLSSESALYITVQGMKQQVHSASSPHGQLTQPVLMVLMGLEREEAVLLDATEPGMFVVGQAVVF